MAEFDNICCKTVGAVAGDEIYQEKVVNLFVQFARCDEHIQEAMATRAVLEGMLFALDELSHLPSVLLNLLHVVCRLTMCAAAWDALEEADAIGASSLYYSNATFRCRFCY